METAKPFGEFARYTFLSVLGMIAISCYILADTFFVSSSLGTNGLAALNLAIPAYNFVHGTGLMLGMGGATRFKEPQGKRRCGRSVHQHPVSLRPLLPAVFPRRTPVRLPADSTPGSR